MTPWILALLASLAVQYGETITVTRYTVAARVLDAHGSAVRDLRPEDFEVTVAGKPAQVEASAWKEGIGAAEDAPEGRLIVFVIGTDYAYNAPRIAGQLLFNEIAGDILELLGPHDRAAVLSYDSHVKLRADFTADKAVLLKAIHDSIGTRPVPLPPPLETGPSLARYLDQKTMRNASTGEQALLILAEALTTIEGEKVVVMASNGLGQMRSPQLFLRKEWHTAMGLLQRMRVPVITLNTGLAGGLAFGLAATASNTNGIYAFVQDFPGQSVQRVAGMLAGHYELVLRSDESLKPGSHDVRIGVKRRDTKVLAPQAIWISADMPAQIDVATAGPDVAIVTKRNIAVAPLFVEAMRRLHDGRTDGVEALLNQAIAADPTLADAYYERAMLAAARGDNEAAANDLRRYLELEPRGKHANDARGMLNALEHR